MSTCANRSTAILVFARAPVPGDAKTRLIPLLGRTEAARLHERLTTHTLSTAVEARVGPVQLWCSPSTDHPFFASCAERYSLSLHRQSGPTLGARLAHAADCELSKHTAVLLVGTDCPCLTTQHLQLAAADLQRNDAVIFPAEDGGYVLLGLAKAIPQAFTGVDWGSARVYAQTMARLAASGSRVAVRDTLWDVDLPADFERLQATSLLAW